MKNINKKFWVQRSQYSSIDFYLYMIITVVIRLSGSNSESGHVGYSGEAIVGPFCSVFVWLISQISCKIGRKWFVTLTIEQLVAEFRNLLIILNEWFKRSSLQLHILIYLNILKYLELVSKISGYLNFFK